MDDEVEMKQVRFSDSENNSFGGILLDSGDLICGCCGGLYEDERDVEWKIEEVYDDWCDLSDLIIEAHKG